MPHRGRRISFSRPGVSLAHCFSRVTVSHSDSVDCLDENLRETVVELSILAVVIFSQLSRQNTERSLDIDCYAEARYR